MSVTFTAAVTFFIKDYKIIDNILFDKQHKIIGIYSCAVQLNPFQRKILRCISILI